MKAKTETAKRLDVVGNGPKSEREIFSSVLKQWRQRLRYGSLFAAIPAVLAAPLADARSDEPTKPDASVAEKGLQHQRLNMKFNRALLKRQSEFLLPHQPTLLAAFAGNDDCPGRIIPGGNYTAAAPYTDSGDTTGANDTVSSFAFIGYDSLGPDLVYSFTITARGPNPLIEVSSTSGTYHPLIYVSQEGQPEGGCPAGTGNELPRILGFDGSTSTAIIDMVNLPLNERFYLFIDSFDSTSSGPYRLRIQDVTIAPASCASINTIDCTEFFVHQHYSDFLNREPDTPGLTFWTNEITACNADAHCAEVNRINVSAAFYLSIEFQQTGYLVYKAYGAAFGTTRIAATVPLTRSEFLPDVQSVAQGVVVGATGWQEQLETNKTAYFNEFVQRPNFVATYPLTMTSAQYVDSLNANAGGALSTFERDELVNELSSGARTRAQVLRAVVDDADFTREHFNRAFVLMQYFGYLRRNPNDFPDHNFDGYNFWLTKLDQFNGNFVQAEMVKAFISSIEYRQRFGPA